MDGMARGVPRDGYGGVIVTFEALNRGLRLAGVDIDNRHRIMARMNSYWHATAAPTEDDLVRLAREYGAPGDEALVLDAVTSQEAAS